MPDAEPLDEFHQRLDDLQEKLNRMRAKCPPGGEARREGEDIQGRVDTLKRKLEGAHGTTWDGMRSELHGEWDALMHSVEKWGARIDKGYREE